jgi:hypothetical protein
VWGGGEEERVESSPRQGEMRATFLVVLFRYSERADSTARNGFGWDRRHWGHVVDLGYSLRRIAVNGLIDRFLQVSPEQGV